jgi:predicted ATP-dependent endonuclease of OLD family
VFLEYLELNDVYWVVYSYFQAKRQFTVTKVDTATSDASLDTELLNSTTANEANKKFKQYLVNKKVAEAFEMLNNNTAGVNSSKEFFVNLTDILREMFEDKRLELQFEQKEFEFYLQFSDGRRVTFNQLSGGFSAFMSIILDLLIKVDIIRKTKGDYTLDPFGIVLIDEPELHFHISMQYLVLPLIAKLFPNIQLIVATHSPAVISSIKDAVVYDLTSQKEVSDTILGSSYSELMISHFGLDNEFSPVADQIIEGIRIAVSNKDPKRLKDLLIENDKYLTPSLRLEIESQIRKLDNAA